MPTFSWEGGTTEGSASRRTPEVADPSQAQDDTYARTSGKHLAAEVAGPSPARASGSGAASVWLARAAAAWAGPVQARPSAVPVAVARPVAARPVQARAARSRQRTGRSSTVARPAA